MGKIIFALVLLISILLVVALIVGRAVLPPTTLPIALIEAREATPPTIDCKSESTVIADLAKQVPDVTNKAYEGPRAADYMRGFNALPPASALQPPERLLIFSSPRIATLLVIGFRKGCQTLVGQISREQHKLILARIDSTI